MKIVKRWSIWQASLDPVIGSEQGKTRPVLIISENDINGLLNVINVLPITSRKSGRTVYPNEVLLLPKSCGLDKESIILCHQIRSIDKKRLIRQYGLITQLDIQNEVIAALCFQLGL